MLIIIIIVQQMEATANENQRGISVTIQMCLCFFYIIILHESLNFMLKWNIQETVQKHREVIHDLMSAHAQAKTL